MHSPVRENLEQYLKGSRELPAGFHAHLEACSGCASALKAMESQSAALRGLRAPEGIEPRVGFYARVMDRIEERRRNSNIWSVLLEPAFGRRLAFASLGLTLLTGGYLVTTEREFEKSAPAEPAAIAREWSPRGTEVMAVSSRQQDRDAVLVNLVSFQE